MKERKDDNEMKEERERNEEGNNPVLRLMD
jgi:hypothetical protein